MVSSVSGVSEESKRRGSVDGEVARIARPREHRRRPTSDGARPAQQGLQLYGEQVRLLSPPAKRRSPRPSSLQAPAANRGRLQPRSASALDIRQHPGRKARLDSPPPARPASVAGNVTTTTAAAAAAAAFNRGPPPPRRPTPDGESSGRPISSRTAATLAAAAAGGRGDVREAITAGRVSVRTVASARKPRPLPPKSKGSAEAAAAAGTQRPKSRVAARLSLLPTPPPERIPPPPDTIVSLQDISEWAHQDELNAAFDGRRDSFPDFCSRSPASVMSPPQCPLFMGTSPVPCPLLPPAEYSSQSADSAALTISGISRISGISGISGISEAQSESTRGRRDADGSESSSAEVEEDLENGEAEDEDNGSSSLCSLGERVRAYARSLTPAPSCLLCDAPSMCSTHSQCSTISRKTSNELEPGLLSKPPLPPGPPPTSSRSSSVTSTPSESLAPSPSPLPRTRRTPEPAPRSSMIRRQPLGNKDNNNNREQENAGPTASESDCSMQPQPRQESSYADMLQLLGEMEAESAVEDLGQALVVASPSPRTTPVPTPLQDVKATLNDLSTRSSTAAREDGLLADILTYLDEVEAATADALDSAQGRLRAVRAAAARAAEHSGVDVTDRPAGGEGGGGVDFLQTLEMEDDKCAICDHDDPPLPRLSELEAWGAPALAREVLALRLAAGERSRALQTVRVAASTARAEATAASKRASAAQAQTQAKERRRWEAILKRNQAFTERLLEDKATLTSRVEALGEQLKTAEARRLRADTAHEQRLRVEVKRARELQAAADRLARSKWQEKHDAQIKETTARALAPELRRLQERHMQQLSELRAQQRRRESEMREKAQREAQAREEQAAENARREFADKLLKMEANSDARCASAAAEAAATARAMERREAEERLQRILQAEKERFEVEGDRRLQEERQRWEAETSKACMATARSAVREAAATAAGREAALREALRVERDREVEAVIERLEMEAENSRRQLHQQTEQRIRRERELHANALREAGVAAGEEREAAVSRVSQQLATERAATDALRAQVERLQKELAQAKEETAAAKAEAQEADERARREREATAGNLAGAAAEAARAAARAAVEEQRRALAQVSERVRAAVGAKETALVHAQNALETAELRAAHLQRGLSSRQTWWERRSYGGNFRTSGPNFIPYFHDTYVGTTDSWHREETNDVITESDAFIIDATALLDARTRETLLSSASSYTPPPRVRTPRTCHAGTSHKSGKGAGGDVRPRRRCSSRSPSTSSKTKTNI